MILRQLNFTVLLILNCYDFSSLTMTQSNETAFNSTIPAYSLVVNEDETNSFTNEIYFVIDDIEIDYVIELYQYSVEIELSCTITGSTVTLGYYMSQYESYELPGWISINEGPPSHLNLIAPEVDQTTIYKFLIQIVNHENSTVVQERLVTLTVNNREIEN